MSDPRAEMLINRSRKNRRRLKGWLRDTGVTCYRLYDRDIPEVPLAIDWYDGRLHVAEYERPGFEEGDAIALGQALADALGVAREDLHVKTRRRQRGVAQYERLDAEQEYLAVNEGGHQFFVNLSDYLDTGLFLDHRPTRLRVEREAAGARFLNLFCYTASFTVYAAAGGARESVSLDLSKTYLGWAFENFRLNDMDTERHRLVRADVMAWLADPPRDIGRFDLAVLDPPTFSNSKSMDGVLDIQRDHGRLIKDTMRLMRPGGVVYFSTNRRGFRLDENLPATVEDITAATMPPDFRKRIRSCYRLVKA